MKTERKIVVLFTGDIHGHLEAWQGWEGELKGKTVGGFDRLATAVHAARSEVGPDNVLLLDSGDAVGDSFIATETKGMAIVQAMNELRYDAISVGNHEPDFGVARLRELMSAATFPFLAANIKTESGELLCKPFVVRDLNGIKVAMLGFAYANTPLTTTKKNIAGLVFEDPRAAAAEWVKQLRQASADVVIALTHYGLSADTKLAEAAHDVDVIIGGHSHNRTKEPIHVGKTVIMHAGAHCSDLGKLVLSFSGTTLTGARGELITLDQSTIPSHKETAGFIQRLTAPFKEQTETIIANAEKPIIHAQTLAGGKPRKRDAQSPADSLFADIIREATRADVAFLPGVGYGVAIQARPITEADLRNLIPHDSKVVTMELTGAQILQILHQALRNTFADDPKTKVGGMIQVSGLRFLFNEESKRVIRCEVGEKNVDATRTYKVATNSMPAEGGHQYVEFRNGSRTKEWSSQYAVIKSALVRRHMVLPPVVTRIHSAR